MIHSIDAIYDHGILRPIEPLPLPDGARVHLRIEEQQSQPKSVAEYHAWLDALVGSWQGEFTPLNEGGFESREPL